MERSILIIYTGGTIGMKQDPVDFTLKPFNFGQILSEVPEIRKFVCRVDTYSFSPLIDSSDAQPEFWIDLARLIKKEYANYDGFVVLHGTDTMSFTASALSFMLENLEKPVVFTGSQLPIGMLRTDGKENLISAVEIASAADEQGRPIVPEVTVFFDSHLYRGNRTIKYSAENFWAFRSENAPALADTGIHIKYNLDEIRYPKQYGNPLKISETLDTDVAILKIFPGMRENMVRALFATEGLRAVILETFGSGNAPTQKWFLDIISEADRRGLIIMNITQCIAGCVDMEAYATGIELKKMGVVSGYDSTLEAALAKLFYLMGKYADNDVVKRELNKNLRGEISI
ncbi:MAG: asparaginase [Candidatus Egerieousia sp.]|nr:asparaginase [bacterium]MDY2650306.1 asparaginase [Candidatus Egerieousia sp.]MDD7072449.1 asparaginase [bacterium]MDD7235671.1 asparaginase [bacterium]MDY3134618.1 asparaginase [Candidatus Egerieousia sp.]